MATNRHTLARAFAVAAPLAALVFLTIGGIIKPGYSHVANFISELSATGSPYATELGLFGFLPLGILVGLFLITAAPLARVEGVSRLGFWLLFSQPVAYLGTFVFPCDLGCPLKGSFSQEVHNLNGVVTYLACATAFLLLSRARMLATYPFARIWFVVIGIVWIIGFFAMVTPSVAPLRGVLQRVLEVSLYGSLLFIAFRMLSATKSPLPER